MVTVANGGLRHVAHHLALEVVTALYRRSHRLADHIVGGAIRRAHVREMYGMKFSLSDLKCSTPSLLLRRDLRAGLDQFQVVR